MSLTRRVRRMELREKEKMVRRIHTEFLENIKGKSNEEVLWEVQRLKDRFGPYIIEEPLENIKPDDLILD